MTDTERELLIEAARVASWSAGTRGQYIKDLVDRIEQEQRDSVKITEGEQNA